MIGLISNHDVAAYLNEIKMLTSWCNDNSLELNIAKTKELVVDFRWDQPRLHHTPLNIHGALVETVSHFKYLGVVMCTDLSWTSHISNLLKMARQRLYHLRKLNKFRICRELQKTFYTIKSVFS